MAAAHLRLAAYQQADPAPSPEPNAEASAILRVASFNRPDADLPVASVHPSQHDAVRPTVFRPLSPAPVSSKNNLGPLGRLPLELASLVCLSLDVASALRLSHASRAARALLAALRPLRHLAAHAVECLCVLLRTGLAPRTAVSALYAALTTRACSLCAGADFAGFLFLPTATRCCLACVASAPETRVGYLARVSDAAGVPGGALEARVPVLRTLPGCRRRVVAVRHALGALREWGGDCGSGSSSHRRGEGEVDDVEAAARGWPDSLTLRLQASTRLPFVDRATGEVERGVACKGCQHAFEADFSDEHRSLRDRLYSRSGFRRHFDECPAAAKLWAASREGIASAEEEHVVDGPG